MAEVRHDLHALPGKQGAGCARDPDLVLPDKVHHVRDAAVVEIACGACCQRVAVEATGRQRRLLVPSPPRT
jgi:hypothetical protein